MVQFADGAWGSSLDSAMGGGECMGHALLQLLILFSGIVP